MYQDPRFIIQKQLLLLLLMQLVYLMSSEFQFIHDFLLSGVLDIFTRSVFQMQCQLHLETKQISDTIPNLY